MENILLSTLTQTVNQNHFVSLITKTTLVGKFVLVLLLVFSVVSWAVIVFKLLEYSKARKNSEKFMNYFRKTKNFSEINKFASLSKNNPLSEIFKSGYRELSYQINQSNNESRLYLESVQRSLFKASNVEITRLERLNGFLATTASVTPFIGLFGTVWGIMSAFQEIGIQSNANLATVAPGIAEALIATALGLFAAIPAVIFYNLLLNKLKVLIARMEDFSLDFLNFSEKLK